MFSPRIVTLNIEASTIRVLITRGKRVARWASVPLEPGLVKAGLILDAERVGSAIGSLFARKKIPKEGVFVSLTGLRCVTRILTLPRLKPALLEEAIRSEAGREMPVSLEELYLSWQQIGVNGAGESRFLVLGAPRTVVDTQLRALRRAGIRPYGIGLKPLALARVVDRKDAIIIDLEPENFDIVLVAGGVPVIMRTLILRGERMTMDDKVRQVVEELSRVVDFYSSSRPERPLDSTTPLVLTGGLGGDPEARQLIGAATGYPIEGVAPALHYPPILPPSDYAVNMGLALGQTSTGRAASDGRAGFPLAAINVLPEAYRPHQIPTRHILYPLAAVLSVALLLTFHLSRIGGEAEIGRIQAELAHVNTQLHRAQQTVTAIHQAEAEAESLNQERDALLGTSGLAHDFGFVLQALPPGVGLSSMTQGAGRVSLEGTADSEQTVLEYANALEETEGFSTAYIASLSRMGEGPASVTFSIIVDE